MQDVKYVMLHLSIGAYRTEAMRAIAEELGDSLRVLSGSRSAGGDVRVMNRADVDHCLVPTLYLPGGSAIQLVSWRLLISVQTVLTDLNPRVPHFWLIVVARRVLGRRTVLWGHAWPRRGSHSLSGHLRLLMARQADAIVTYTRRQADELGPRLRSEQSIVAAPNSLYRKDQFEFSESTVRSYFVYVGRLIEEKKPELLLIAFEEYLTRGGSATLVVVGDGPRRSHLEVRASRESLRGRVEFLGHVGEYAALREIYSGAIASVSPGYVGLSIIQSLSFGVPMLVADKEPHSPEIEAAQPGFNTAFFRSNDVESLVKMLLEVESQSSGWSELGRRIAEDAAEKYSVESMAAGVLKAMRGG